MKSGRSRGAGDAGTPGAQEGHWGAGETPGAREGQRGAGGTPRAREGQPSLPALAAKAKPTPPPHPPPGLPSPPQNPRGAGSFALGLSLTCVRRYLSFPPETCLCKLGSMNRRGHAGKIRENKRIPGSKGVRTWHVSSKRLVFSASGAPLCFRHFCILNRFLVCAIKGVEDGSEERRTVGGDS